MWFVSIVDSVIRMCLIVGKLIVFRTRTTYVLLYYMYYYITCITILHVLLYYYRNRLKLYTEDINEHDTPQLEWVFI